MPARQTKKYRMDLGQNTGPFKARDPYGNPLVDMFSPQEFKEQQTNAMGMTNLKKTMSPRIGILGANTFSIDGSASRKLEN